MIRPNTKKAYDFFHSLTLALAQVEHNGITVDTVYLDKAMEEVGTEIKDRERQLREEPEYRAWRKRFKEPNLESDAQLRTLLFDVLGYKPKGYTDSSYDEDGNLLPNPTPSVDERALERLKVGFVDSIVACKKLRKVRNTYLSGIRREVCGGLLRPSYNLAGGLDDERKGGARSYRGSGSDPNFQNMPIRNKTMGKIIRSCFTSRRGYLLGELDFSTIEVRVAACVTKDRVLIDYVKDKSKDMHRDAAGLIFHMTPEFLKEHKDWAKKTVRDSAKNRFVFPQFYGSFYVDCAENMWEMMKRGKWMMPDNPNRSVRKHLKRHGIMERGACDETKSPRPGTFELRVKEVEDIFWNQWFKEYTAWKKRWYQEYLETGEVYMPTGFTAAGVYRRNQVLNLPIQGPAFHCLGWSIIEIQKELKRRKMKTKIVGQIHDCFLADIWEPELQDFLNLAREVMTERLPKAWPWIIVPLEIEVDIVPQGMTWNDKALWKPDNSGVWVAA